MAESPRLVIPFDDIPPVDDPAIKALMQVALDAGVTAVAQPGGSMRDEEVIAAADERGVAMVFCGERHFRH